MSILNTGGLTAEQAEALFNLANNGVLTRIDERGHRCEDLYQWGLHPHTAETGSALAADDDAFTATYPLTLAGPQAVTEHALFPARYSLLSSPRSATCRGQQHRLPCRLLSGVAGQVGLGVHLAVGSDVGPGGRVVLRGGDRRRSWRCRRRRGWC